MFSHGHLLLLQGALEFSQLVIQVFPSVLGVLDDAVRAIYHEGKVVVWGDFHRVKILQNIFKRNVGKWSRHLLRSRLGGKGGIRAWV